MSGIEERLGVDSRATPPPPGVVSRRRRRRLLVAAVALAALGAISFVLVYFQPQKLVIDDRVDEAFPVDSSPVNATSTVAPLGSTATPPSSVAGGPTTTTAPSQPTQPAAPVAEGSGAFVSREHDTSGVATVYRLEDGRRILRLEDLETSNGPDLYVYLSAGAADGPGGEFDDVFVDLGALKGNIGDQNYDIPEDVDLGQYRSVVIWCDRFDVAFGAAAFG